MHRGMRKCLQDFLYIAVLIELLLIIFVFPITLVNRTAAPSRNDREQNGRVVTHWPREPTNASVDQSPLRVTRKNASQVKTFNESRELFTSPRLLRQKTTDPSENVDLWGCREIDRIAIGRILGKGTTKQVQKGEFDGRPVVVKTVSDRVNDITSCRRKKGKANIASCYRFANYKVLKEIALLQQLRHPNIAKLLGYCIRDESSGRESVRLVMEYGQPVEIRKVQWPAKLQLAIDLAELLHFLHVSPVGPLRIGDFKRDQFRKINNTLKLSDLDDLTADELSCTDQSDCFILNKDMGVPCIESVCKGFNTVANVKVAKERFFNTIFGRPPLSVKDESVDLLRVLSTEQVDTESLRNKIDLIKKQYEEATK